MKELTGRLGASYLCLGEQDEYLYDIPELRLRLVNAIRLCRADVIFTHFSPDYNVDHMTVTEIVRQCALHSILACTHTEAPLLKASPAVFLVEPSGGFGFEPTHYVDITPFIERKRELARYHKSQDDAFHAALHKGLDDWMLENTRYRGAQAGVEHAEGFRPFFARGLVKAYAILP